MSHVVKLNLEIKNIKAAKRACAKLGLNFVEDKKTFRYYGSSQSKCDHAITGGSMQNEVGLVKEGNSYSLRWDPGYGGVSEALGGRNAEGFRREYAAAAATLQAESEGMYVTRYDRQDGTIELTATPS